MTKSRDEYIPALKYRFLTSLYDPLLYWVLRESKFKRCLVQQGGIESGHRVLDLGCGTGTLALMIKRTQQEAEVVGLDGDPKVLEIAKAKVARSGQEITMENGMAYELPYPNDSFDRVLSSLLFHHLTRENKVRTLSEVFRVLRPGGQLHVADWGTPSNISMRITFLSVQMLDGFKTTADNVNGLLPELFSPAGFEVAQESAQYMTISGSLSLYRARKPR